MIQFNKKFVLSISCIVPTLILSACNNAGASSTTPYACDSSLVINTSSNTISSVESYAQQIKRTITIKTT